jgi:putative FmdB family regulatory protein
LTKLKKNVYCRACDGVPYIKIIKEKMPTYLYVCTEHGEFEEYHSIKDEVKECPFCKKEGKISEPPKRLISKGSNFILTGSGWAKDNYS